MRYLIIDREKMGSGGDFIESGTPIITISTNCVLSEEETMEKFKEIWQDGYNSGYDELSYPPKKELKDWKELKETL